MYDLLRKRPGDLRLTTGWAPCEQRRLSTVFMERLWISSCLRPCGSIASRSGKHCHCLSFTIGCLLSRCPSAPSLPTCRQFFI